MIKLIICLMSLVFAFTLFGNSQQETTVKNGKQKIRWVRAGNEQNPETDRILLELQDKLGIELEIISIPWDQFPNKLNIMMASGEQIDLINCDPGVTLNNWVNEGLVLSYDDYVGNGKYPYIESVVNSDLYAGLKINGKSYYKPLPLAPMQ